MVTGIVLILCGALIAIYPQLLSLIVAVFLILLGIVVLTVANDYRRHAKRNRVHLIDYIFRY